MQKETLIALHGSIQKWLRIARGEAKDRGPADCPLCQRFNGCMRFTGSQGNYHQESCPIKNRTGQFACMGTPYMAIRKPAGRETNALRMVWFLCSLLPEDDE